MKSSSLLIVLAFLSLGVLVSCAQASAPSSTTPADSQSPAIDATDAPDLEPTEPTQAEQSSSWQTLQEMKVKHKTTVAGFLNDQFGLTAGYAGEIHYTTDGGKTWPRAENKSACRFGLDIVDEKVAWTVGNSGNVRVSTDGGQTWQAVTNLSRLSHFVSFIDAHTGWVATRNILWATDDGGQTWAEVSQPEGIADLVEVSLATTNDGYLIDKSGSLYITRDRGQTWTTESLGLTDLPLADVAHGAAIRFFDMEHGILVAGLAGDGQSKVVMMQTTDGGKTWETEELPVKIGTFFLSHDGKTLTVTRLGGGEVIVLGNPAVPEVLPSSR